MDFVHLVLGRGWLYRRLGLRRPGRGQAVREGGKRQGGGAGDKLLPGSCGGCFLAAFQRKTGDPTLHTSPGTEQWLPLL